MKHKGREVRQPAPLRDVTDGVLPGVPLVEISGTGRVLIEHHQGVVAYGCNEIRVRVRYGSLAVCGSNLNLARMSREQLVICGCIDSVCLFRNGGTG